MAQLLNTEFLGSVFLEDLDPNFIKIDNVVLGETFPYKTITKFDIGVLLETALLDPEIVAVVYNWKHGIGYMKSGINSELSGDSNVNEEYTTFIVASRV